MSSNIITILNAFGFFDTIIPFILISVLLFYMLILFLNKEKSIGIKIIALFLGTAPILLVAFALILLAKILGNIISFLEIFSIMAIILILILFILIKKFIA
jgi:hypothetical protein